MQRNPRQPAVHRLAVAYLEGDLIQVLRRGAVIGRQVCPGREGAGQVAVLHTQDLRTRNNSFDKMFTCRPTRQACASAMLPQLMPEMTPVFPHCELICADVKHMTQDSVAELCIVMPGPPERGPTSWGPRILEAVLPWRAAVMAGTAPQKPDFSGVVGAMLALSEVEGAEMRWLEMKLWLGLLLQTSSGVLRQPCMSLLHRACRP